LHPIYSEPLIGPGGWACKLQRLFAPHGDFPFDDVMTNSLISRILLRIRPSELAEALKYFIGPMRRLIKINDDSFWIDPASNLGDRLITEGQYEEHLEQILRQELKDGDVFIDLGANEGYFSVIASRLVGKQGRVYVIEPQSRLWPVILKNFQLNARFNYTLIPYLVGEKSGEAELNLSSTINTGASTTVHRTNKFLKSVQKSPMLRLDELINHYQISRVGLLKIDIEGMELDALKSLGALLNSNIIRNIVVELHPEKLRQLKQDPGEVGKLLSAKGYKLIARNQLEHWKVFPTK
jgi:FkbM family methyltransferase